jgi:GT2 family glycosyltransferase
MNKTSHEEINKIIFEKFRGKVLEMNRSLAFFCVVMHRNTFNKVGYLDERYGLGLYDDDDYCQRIVAHNLKLLLALDVYVWHLASTTFKKMYSSNDFMKKLLENQKIFQAKWNE